MNAGTVSSSDSLSRYTNKVREDHMLTYSKPCGFSKHCNKAAFYREGKAFNMLIEYEGILSKFLRDYLSPLPSFSIYEELF